MHPETSDCNDSVALITARRSAKLAKQTEVNEHLRSFDMKLQNVWRTALRSFDMNLANEQKVAYLDVKFSTDG